MGEAGALTMRLSRDVLRDTEYLLKRRKPELLSELALILHQADFSLTTDPNEGPVDDCEEMTGYRPDARVLAAAVECGADLFITHDTLHFLQNPLVGPPNTRLRVVTHREALEWCLEKLIKT